jgi:hypothetical protein
VDCALGIAVKSYLDELSAQSEPTSELSRQTVKTKGANEWFPHAIDLQGDLQRAFDLWDSVSLEEEEGKEEKEKERKTRVPRMLIRI